MSATAEREAGEERVDQAGLRATIEALARWERPPTSEGERLAAQWLEERFRAIDCRTVEIDRDEAYDSYARPLARLSAIGAVAGVTALTGRSRAAAAALAAAVTAAMADDISAGPQLFRRLTMRRRSTWNVVAETGDPDAPRTLLLLAHHDAAPTGRIFDQSFQRWLARTFPRLVESTDTALPIWWPVVGSAAVVAAGAALGRRGLTWIGLGGCLLATASFADIERSPTVPGANDNLSGVAVLVAIAERLRQRPVPGLRVVLASCGSEESLQGGIRGFARKHFPRLPTDSTVVLNLDTLGSPRLIMLEGEGPLVMEDYPDAGFRDLVARAAERAGVALRRGMRARSSTDSVIPSRAGYPTATLASVDHAKALSNYHLPTDTPENVDYGTVAEAVAVVEAVMQELAA